MPKQPVKGIFVLRKMAASAMGKLDDLARQRVNEWLVSTGTTQVQLGQKIGRNQAWMSRYLDEDPMADRIETADLDTLALIAKAFGHSLFHLLDVPSDPVEAEVSEIYRALRPEARPIVLASMKLMKLPARRGRTRARKAG